MLRSRCGHEMNQWWIRWCPSLTLILKLIYNGSDCEVFAVLIVTLNITFDHFIVDQIFIQLNKFNSLTLGYFTVIIKCDNCDEWIIIQMVYSNSTDRTKWLKVDSCDVGKVCEGVCTRRKHTGYESGKRKE